ncbi:hypothetical protein DyAD56_01775 [Dyella sp. AD56]|nr:hypothetical protein DyAD56_01775 [Dyella sp. AD56]
MSWLVEERGLWIAVFVALLLGIWLQSRGRRKGARGNRMARKPQSRDKEIAVLALGWDGVSTPDASTPVLPSHGGEAEMEASLRDHDAVPAVAFTPPPIDQDGDFPVRVFNALNSPGGACATWPAGDALRHQRSVIRAAVDTGEGNGVSFKLPGNLEWPLWARLPCPGAQTSAAVFAFKVLGADELAAREPTGKSPDTQMSLPRAGNDGAVASLEALEAHLQRHPDDVEAKRVFGLQLFAEANEEPDEAIRAGMMDAGIHALLGIPPAERGTAARLQLGEACRVRALIGPEVDEALLLEAEGILRAALADDDRPQSEAAWQLQSVLRVVLRERSDAWSLERLEEARALLVRGGASSPLAPNWRAALLQTELQIVQVSALNASERRLRLRGLHIAWSETMKVEHSAAVLGVCIELLCEMAGMAVGKAALERYADADALLARLRSCENEEVTYARAFALVALGRAELGHGTSQTSRLEEVESILAPFIEQHPDLRLQACRAVLAWARHKGRQEALPLYQRAVELSRPLTGTPTFMRGALQCMVEALLALDEVNDRPVYAKCLEMMTGPNDAGALQLLAESALRLREHRSGCSFAEQAWRAGGHLPMALVALWKQGYGTWEASEGASEEVSRNRQCLRMAMSAAGEHERFAR